MASFDLDNEEFDLDLDAQVSNLTLSAIQDPNNLAINFGTYSLASVKYCVQGMSYLSGTV